MIVCVRVYVCVVCEWRLECKEGRGLPHHPHMLLASADGCVAQCRQVLRMSGACDRLTVHAPSTTLTAYFAQRSVTLRGDLQQDKCYAISLDGQSSMVVCLVSAFVT
eukprot:scpid37939/ scgid34931/ 